MVSVLLNNILMLQWMYLVWNVAEYSAYYHGESTVDNFPMFVYSVTFFIVSVMIIVMEVSREARNRARTKNSMGE